MRDPADHAAWREFEGGYRELLVRYCRKRGLQHADADDVVQIVFLNLSKSLPQFVYDPQRGRFRDYLYRCTRNSIANWAERRKAGGAALFSDMDATRLGAAGEQADASDAELWQQEWVAHHYRMALERLRGEFDAHNLEIFNRNVAGESVADLAAAFGVTEQAVYAARRRIRARLEELVAEQVRDEDAVDAAPARPA